MYPYAAIAVICLSLAAVILLWVAVDEVREHRRRQKEREALRKFLQDRRVKPPAP